MLSEMKIGWLQIEKEGPLGPLAEEALKKSRSSSFIFARMKPTKICCSVALKPMDQLI
jgi:hypothetical protein